jgi:hypothetical protein
MNDPVFRLYWLRESASDFGTPMSAEGLPASIRERILALAREPAGEPSGEFAVRLPYMDQRELRRPATTLAAIRYERTGRLIRAVLPPAAATRDMLATLALADPVWRAAPRERDPGHFHTWQRVSQALQHWLRDRVAAEYFRDLKTLADRTRAHPMIVYQACRIFPGRPRTDFTYDLSNYPWCQDTLAFSWRLSGAGIQRVMKALQQRLLDAGETALAYRYSPVLANDVLLAVQRKPKAYVNLLARESEIINAVIEAGTQRDAESIHNSAKVINQALAAMHFQDLRRLGMDLLLEARRALAGQPQASTPQPADGGDHVAGLRALQRATMSAARRPDGGIGGEEDRDHGDACGRGEVRDSGVVADIDARGGKPARQLV